MDAATHPDQGQGEPCANKTARIIAALADGPRTLADLKGITRDPHSLILDARAKGAVITCDKTAKPAIYHLEQMPPDPTKVKPGPKAKPKPPPKAPQAPRLHRSFEGSWWTAADFHRLTGLPATALPLRWHVGKFPARVVFDRLADAAKQDPAYRPVLFALSAGVKQP